MKRLVCTGVAALILAAGCSPVTKEPQSSILATSADQRPAVVEQDIKAPDFSQMGSTKLRKKAFFDFLRPFYQQISSQILAERQKVMILQQRFEQGEPLDDSEHQWLAQLASQYGLRSEPLSQSHFDQILLRVDTLPEALVLSQAANESGWGTSRFARQGNNYFGQWCYSQGCGLVPLQRSSGAIHEVKVFPSAYDSVKAYFSNVNTNAAYRDLRAIRAKLRSEGKPLNPLQLAEGLNHYSERGQAYVVSIQQFIEQNQSYWQVTG
ncbi:glucosaminidase domain-containing protein [Dongshaea marina]|uniref:glucosaminidase domain-containing protein n=1 Tax=Dongshaea marina TaxID=2047966 RepID=UPI0019023747|nr:glucosaminidase domain-containing protein [Dongshaea marina]